MGRLRDEYEGVNTPDAHFKDLRHDIGRLEIDDARKQELLRRLNVLEADIQPLGYMMDSTQTLELLAITSGVTTYALEVEGVAGSDHLTEIANMRSFKKEAKRTQARMERDEVKSAAVLFIDARDFGKINKLYGDPVGDKAIQRLAEILSECTRSTDYVARLRDADEAFERVRDNDAVARKGGDEFPILVTSKDPDCDFEIVRQRIYDAFEGATLHSDGHEIPLEVSIGLAPFKRGQNIESCLKAADEDMRREKGQQYKKLGIDHPLAQVDEHAPEIT